MILKFFLFLFIIATQLNASILLKNDSSNISILDKSMYFIDKSGTKTIDDIFEEKFKKSDFDYAKLGYTKDTLWIKFSIKNNTNINQIKYLTLSNPILDTIELYKKKDNTYIKEVQGKLQIKNKSKESIIHPHFEINLKKNESKTFYLKTHSISSANYYQLFLKNDSNLYKDDFNYQLIQTFFFGTIIALIIYNIFIFIFTKEKTFLYYVLYILFVIINHASYSYMINLILTDNNSNLDGFLNLYYISIATIFALLFIKSFLNIEKQKIHNNIINLLIVIHTIIMLLNTKENYLINIASVLVTISTLFILYISIYSYYKKMPQAKYILIGWIINIAGIIAISLKQQGINNPIDYFPYFYELSAFLEAVLFSIALASKLSKTRELENSLKTNKVLLKELHHRVKNNMQFIILLYRLKLADLITPKIDEKLYETEGAIQAMSKVHETLYSNENLDEIDTREYFEDLISKLKESFNISNIKINLDISSSINVDKSLYCGIILNELITNALKYAFKNNKGQIDIVLKDIRHKHLFQINDNGCGFDYDEKTHDSFGLVFVQSIVKDELDGKIDFKNNNGTKINILF